MAPISETLLRSVRPMPLDTVKLRSPALTEATLQKIERRCIRRQAQEIASGVMLYEITTGHLQASWDSRISVRPMREDWVANSSGRTRLQSCPPYLMVECSLPKAFFGQNIYGGPTDLQLACARLVELLEMLLEVSLPPAADWIVRRIDWAESFSLPFIAIQEFFDLVQSTYFPRRKIQKYGDHGIYVPGRTTTLKIYHKGIEFAANDSKRIKRALLSGIPLSPRNAHLEANMRARVSRRVQALQRLANKRLRVEVEVHADKLDFDFGKRPRVKEVTDDYLARLFDHEVGRLLREGRDSLQRARTNRDVASRLIQVYGRTAGNRLHGFWCRLATCGENVCKREYPAATFYRNRKRLQDAGVSWHNTDVQIVPSRAALPNDFSPTRFDSRRCVGHVRRENSTLSLPPRGRFSTTTAL